MSRYSVFKYKGREANVEAIGRELRVHGVLTGRIAQRGDNISISVELVDVRDNAQVWGEQFSRRMTDLSALQDDIARQVSQNLRLRLSGDEREQRAALYPRDSEVYQMYLKGRFFANKRTEDGLSKGAAYLQQAIREDPNYALAYAALADCYALLYEYTPYPSNDLYRRAKEAALRALQLDDTLAEAHTSLAAAYEHEWNWDDAERQYLMAIEINPNYATAHHWYSAYLTGRKRFDEAIGEAKRAVDLDPLSLIVNTALGRAYYGARRYDEASPRADSRWRWLSKEKDRMTPPSASWKRPASCSGTTR
jgi:tetratricopeptide (TPR) repeat protein